MTRESTRRHLLGAMAALGTGSAVVGKVAAGDGPVGTAVGADAVEVVATDGAGGQTERTVSPDRE